jgi:hypothetical protein
MPVDLEDLSIGVELGLLQASCSAVACSSVQGLLHATVVGTTSYCSAADHRDLPTGIVASAVTFGRHSGPAGDATR